jgi:putative methyltransferase
MVGVGMGLMNGLQALLKRWSETCPEMLHPKRSHRHGDLGFRAGE